VRGYRTPAGLIIVFVLKDFNLQKMDGIVFQDVWKDFIGIKITRNVTKYTLNVNPTMILPCVGLFNIHNS
jgi:hypothetical protein